MWCGTGMSRFDQISAMHAHAHLGALGVFVMLIVGISYKLVPMFTFSDCSIVDLGLIYGIEVDEADGKSNVRVSMTMTTPACPFGPELVREVKEIIAALEGVGTADVQITLSPPWTPDRMTEDARDELGIF